MQSIAGIFINKLSDHQPYFMIIDTALKKRHPPKFIRIDVQTMEAMIKVKNELSESNLYNKLDPSMVADVNLNYNIINCEINKAKNKYMTSKLIKFKRKKHKLSPWITHGILSSIRYRDKLYKQLRLTNPYSLQYNALKYNLKAYNSVLKRSIRLAKKMYFAARFTNCKYDIKKTWKTINEILSS